MEEEVGQPFTSGALEGAQSSGYYCAPRCLRPAAVFMLVWIKPTSDNSMVQAPPVQQEAAPSEASGEPPDEPANSAATDRRRIPPREAESSNDHDPGYGRERARLVCSFRIRGQHAPRSPRPGGFKMFTAVGILDMSVPPTGSPTATSS